MPFTPFHIGFGLAANASAGNRPGLVARGIGALAPWCSRGLTALLVRRWNVETSHYRLCWLGVPGALSYRVLGVGAFLGTLSHVGLDSLMHADMRPLAPFSDANPLLGLVAHDSVYSAMGVCGVAGGLCWLVRQRGSGSRGGEFRSGVPDSISVTWSDSSTRTTL